MLVNNAISAGLGVVPVIGDVALATFKANSRNAALLEEYLRIRGEEYLKSQSQSQKRLEGDSEKIPPMSKEDLLEHVKPGAGVVKGERVSS